MKCMNKPPKDKLSREEAWDLIRDSLTPEELRAAMYTAAKEIIAAMPSEKLNELVQMKDEEIRARVLESSGGNQMLAEGYIRALRERFQN